MRDPAPAAVLLVEEHLELRAALRDWLLMSFPPLRLQEADCMEEALAQARRTDFGLALVTLELPGPTGIEATRELRRCRPECRVVVMSLHDSEALRLAAFAAGACAFVAKRELPGVLYAVIHRFLVRPAADAVSVRNDTTPI